MASCSWKSVDSVSDLESINPPIARNEDGFPIASIGNMRRLAKICDKPFKAYSDNGHSCSADPGDYWAESDSEVLKDFDGSEMFLARRVCEYVMPE